MKTKVKLTTKEFQKLLNQLIAMDLEKEYCAFLENKDGRIIVLKDEDEDVVEFLVTQKVKV